MKVYFDAAVEATKERNFHMDVIVVVVVIIIIIIQ